MVEFPYPMKSYFEFGFNRIDDDHSPSNRISNDVCQGWEERVE